MVDIQQLPQVVTYPHGTQRYWIENNTIAVLVIAGGSAAEMNEAAQATYDLIHESPYPGNLFVIAHAENLRNLTPAARKTAAEFYAELPKTVHVSSAIVLRDSLMQNLLGLFLTGLRRIIKMELNYRTFRDEASALAWLQTLRQDVSQSA